MSAASKIEFDPPKHECKEEMGDRRRAAARLPFFWLITEIYFVCIIKNVQNFYYALKIA